MNSLNNLDNQFRKMLNNKSVVSVLSLLLALYAGAAAPKLPNEVVLFFDSVLGKTLFMFLIVYLSSRNTQLSIMVAVAFLVTLTCMNKRNLEGFDNHPGNNQENTDDDNEEDEEGEEAEEGEEEEPQWHKDTPHDHNHDEEDDMEEDNEEEDEDEPEDLEKDPDDSGEGFKSGKKGKKVKEHFRYSFKKHKYTPAPVPVRENFQNYAPFPRKR